MGLSSQEIMYRTIIPFLAPVIKDIFMQINPDNFNYLEEIRLRCAQPLLLKTGAQEWAVNRQGGLEKNLAAGYVVCEEDIFRTLISISDNSLYAFEEEIRRGFITIPGGHRVGLAGQVLMAGGEVKTIKDFSSLSFRIAREVKDCSLPLLRHIYQHNMPGSTLLISAPRCGKTTILRDLARNISAGNHWGPACTLSVIDERSELAGSYRGRVQMDLGPRTDVLDACPKALGMMMAIRALGPQVIITDEIGRQEDIAALQECINAGVTVIASAHARDLSEARKRPMLQEILACGAFQTLITLSRRQGPGTVEEIIRWD
ncbi:Sporulation stage III, protein AA [Syntrophomonas zehnderi OL-4]|uniref:Sporulation stage III, protein AA n=1 Tax=Syntrophomonas zehnderi OL-4 TaxID=690567 RepID=A0A0E4GAI4_9FIRM|nr:stage III sporulation protein AA [Syntrophomonas zehnderi]CFX49045.1 Sporulation stage III, protein AA [Syntrophomonas zehnderi OL-4]